MHQSTLPVFLGICVLACAEAHGFSLFLEAETFDNLPSYGNFVDVKGWYVKRHSHASGGAFVCAHHPGGAMTRNLAAPIAPGDYRFYLRVCLNRSFGTTNLLRVALGLVDDRGGFTPEAEADYAQIDIGSGYSWIQVPADFKPAKPCNAIRIAAVQVDNLGIGDDPEYPLPCAILDGVMLTDEKVELYKPTIRDWKDIRFLSGVDPRGAADKLPYPAIPSYRAPNPFSPRPAFLAQKNLLRNSSFECALKPHFAASREVRLRNSGFNVDADCLSTDRPYHGRTCVKLPARLKNRLTDFTGNTNALVYGNGLSLYAMTAFLQPEIATLEKAGPLTISLYLRTDGKPLSFTLCGKKFEAAPLDWERFTAPFSTQYLAITKDIFGFTTTNAAAGVWLDAIQIERGPEPTAYQPLDGLEVGFQLPATAAIVYRDKPLPLECVVAQAGGEKTSYEVSYSIFNHLLDKVTEGSLRIESEPGRVAAKPAPIPFGRLGSYLFVYQVKGHPEQGYAIPFAVVENVPKPRARLLGAITDSNEESLRIFSHAGFDWINSLQDEIVSTAWVDRETVKFYDNAIDQAQNTFDLEFGFWRAPFQIAANMRKDPSSVLYGKEAAAHMGRPNASYDYWERFVDIVTRHYRQVRVWMLTDEQSYHRGIAESIPYFETGSRLVRANSPKSTLFYSSQALYFFDLLAMKPNLDLGHAFGGSRHGLPRTMYFYDRRLKAQTGLQYWALAVGWWVEGSWDSGLNFETFQLADGWWAANSPQNVLSSIFNEAAIVGVERFGIYTAKYDAGQDPKCIYAKDNTFKPYGIQLINSVNFVRGHKPGNVIRFDSASGLSAVYLRRGNGKTCVLLEPDGSYANIELALGLPADQVTIYDFNLNPVPYADRWVLPVNKCLLVEDNGIGEEALLGKIRSLDAHPLDFERRVILPSATGAELVTFKREGGAMKETARVAMPAAAGIAYPIDQTKSDRKNSWASVAGRINPDEVKLDGRSDEPGWSRVASSYVYCWPGLGGSYQAMQGISNFERILSLNDLSVSFKTLWDGSNLLAVFDVLDDALADGDGLVVKLDAELLKDLDARDLDGDDFSVVLKPDWKTGKVEPIVLDSAGREVGRGEAALAKHDGGYGIEVRLPLKLLNAAPAASRSMGLGVDVLDADPGDPDPAILSWTTDYAPRRSPWGFGQLVLK